MTWAWSYWRCFGLRSSVSQLPWWLWRAKRASLRQAFNQKNFFATSLSDLSELCQLAALKSSTWQPHMTNLMMNNWIAQGLGIVTLIIWPLNAAFTWQNSGDLWRCFFTGSDVRLLFSRRQYLVLTSKYKVRKSNIYRRAQFTCRYLEQCVQRTVLICVLYLKRNLELFNLLDHSHMLILETCKILKAPPSMVSKIVRSSRILYLFDG